MRRYRILLFAVLALVIAAPFTIRSQTQEALRKVMSDDRGEIEQLDRLIVENKKLFELFGDHEFRLRSLAENHRIYRLPVLIEDRALHVTLNDPALEDFSNSLALDDLLARYKVTKGRFQSDDPQEWKKILISESTQCKDRLRDVEIPAIGKRIKEVDQATASIKARRKNLQEKINALQRRLAGA